MVVWWKMGARWAWYFGLFRTGVVDELFAGRSEQWARSGLLSRALYHGKSRHIASSSSSRFVGQRMGRSSGSQLRKYQCQQDTLYARDPDRSTERAVPKQTWKGSLSGGLIFLILTLPHPTLVCPFGTILRAPSFRQQHQHQAGELKRRNL